MPIAIGNRTVLALSCGKCAKLLPGSAYGYHTRNFRDKAAYIDRRCPDCKWGAKLKGKRNG
jgi:phage FluMu protein Com